MTSKDRNILRKRTAFLLIAFSIALHTNVSAQVNLRGPVASAMGGGGAASMNTADAMFINPANVFATNGGKRITLSVGRISAFAGGDLMQFKYYNDAFTSGDELSDALASQIVEDWFGDPQSGALRNAGFGAEAVPVAFTMQFDSWAFGASVRSRTTTKLGVSGGWLDLLLVGDEEQRSLPMNADLRLLSTTEIGFAFSKSLADGLVTIGIAPRYILGNEFMENIFESTATVTPDSIIHEFDYVSRAAGGLGTRIVDNLSFFSPAVIDEDRYSPSFLGGAGSGYGFDMGITIHPVPSLYVSASITDMGSITWNDQAETARPANNIFRFDGLNLDLDRLNDEFNGDIVAYAESVLDSLARDAYEDVITETGGFSSSLPAAVHLGGSYRLMQKLTLTGGSSVALNRVSGNVARDPSFHVGTEYVLGGAIAFPLRAGMHLAGDGALALAAGFGLRTPIYDLDIGFIATPRTDIMGAGGRYAVSVSLVNIKI